MIIRDSSFILLCSVIAFVTVFGRSHTGQVGGNHRKSRAQSTPRYMVELYERYKNGQMSFLQKSSTTVRSILPMKGKMEGGEMLVYNLTGVPRTEVIVKAELHAHIRRKKSKTHAYILNFWDLMLTSSPPLEQRRIGEEVGWTVYDVTKAVLSCRTENGENQYLLGVSVQSSNDRRKLRPLPVRRLVGSNPQPFLVLFSNDKSIDNPNTTDTFQSRLDDIVNKYVQNSRKKRSVHDNKLPEYPVYQVNSLQLVPSSGSYGKTSRFLHKANNTGSKKQRGRKDKKKRKHRKLPFLRGKWNTPHENDATIIDDDELGIGTCQKKKLVVDFAEIGWTEWIISPKYFETDYCSGQCPFPLTKSLLPSNHATLQSLVHALNLDPNVPPPCCVPEVTSSLTLLYFDDDSNVVLKNYPNMVVESCACR